MKCSLNFLFFFKYNQWDGIIDAVLIKEGILPINLLIVLLKIVYFDYNVIL